MIVVISVLLYLLGMLAAAVGSRLAGRCATWCCAVCGLPAWVVNGTVVSFCIVLPQLMLAFIAAGLDATALSVGCALAGAVIDLGLVLPLCFLRREGFTGYRPDLIHKCILLILACLVLVLFVRDGTLSYTGTGLLMALFVTFVLDNIAQQYRETHGEEMPTISLSQRPGARTLIGQGFDTMQFPSMSLAASLKNLAGTILGVTVLAVGAVMLLFVSVLIANITGTIQALWASTLVSLGFSLPLLAEAFHHPLGSLWMRFARRCCFYPENSLPIQTLNNAILSITLVLPVSSLMYRQRLPIGAQYRSYELPACLVLSLLLLLPLLFGKRLHRWQGALGLSLYFLYLGAVLLAPLAGA